LATSECNAAVAERTVGGTTGVIVVGATDGIVVIVIIAGTAVGITTTFSSSHSAVDAIGNVHTRNSDRALDYIGEERIGIIRGFVILVAE
jgi:hypothetical protein